MSGGLPLVGARAERPTVRRDPAVNDTALAVEPPLRRVVRLVDRPAEQPEPGLRTPEPAAAHDRSRPAHCRIAMQFED
ncbi:hypothetical protein KAURM247S_01750 [Kitasatospora aureofaciens]